jgi:hypothetical protein
MAKVEATVEELVMMIERGELRLPEMQRQYVWRSTRVRDLSGSAGLGSDIPQARRCGESPSTIRSKKASQRLWKKRTRDVGGISRFTSDRAGAETRICNSSRKDSQVEALASATQVEIWSVRYSRLRLGEVSDLLRRRLDIIAPPEAQNAGPPPQTCKGGDWPTCGLQQSLGFAPRSNRVLVS